MGHRYAELRRMSVDDLVHEYDRIAKDVPLTVNLCRQEIARREMEEHGQRMLAMTVEVRWLTRVITVLTAVNVILVAPQFWMSLRPCPPPTRPSSSSCDQKEEDQ